MTLLFRLTAALCFAWIQPLAKAEEPSATITTVGQLFNSTFSSKPDLGRSFEVSAVVTLPCCERRHRTMAIEDKTGASLVTLDKLSIPFSAQRGDLVSLRGTIASDHFGRPCASCASARLLARSAHVSPAIRNPMDFSSFDYRCRVIEIAGTITDAFVDEIDPNYMFVILRYGKNQTVVATESDGRSARDCLPLIGRKATVFGVSQPNMYGIRAYLGQNIRTIPEYLQVSGQDAENPFDAQELDAQSAIRPEDILSAERRTVRGMVVAAWGKGRALVRTSKGRIVRICVTQGHVPEHGEAVEAVGFPETDLYRINLTRCLCRALDESSPKEEPALPLTARQLTCDASGRVRYDMDYHGRRVRISGRILGYAPRDGLIEKALLGSEDQHIAVCFSASHDIPQKIPVGSQVEIDGTCVMDTESWSPYAFFPRIQEVLVSVAGPERIRIVSLPSWWTPARFTAVCVSLLAILCGIVLWNLTLNRIVTRKSQQLKREITARLASNLKTRERTRLAVELHDSIAQTLSGTAMEIGSAIRCADNASAEMMAHLQTASQTLRSCRDDLRDCLWDLRSNALEVDSMDEAILTTLRPIIGNVTPVVRFNVRRKRLSDNTAHALLRIIHELVSNAIRHGRARTIRIAGSLDDRRLLFSVRDDGCGFDAGHRPGATEGHFGLEGIRERIRHFNGTMTIDSSPAQGTKVAISLDVSFPEEEDLIET